jgi:uncharacterized protein YdiU (UPF0061 family)
MSVAETSSAFAFDNSYARLPDRFFARQEPTPVAKPQLIRFNAPLARDLGISVEGLDDTTRAALFAGNALPAGSEPIAQAYSGHQFGSFSPQLGDGRAVLLGEVVTPDGRRRDIQLKGAGPTQFSRRGDGRAALGPVLREYIVSEAFAALGIPTTRALAAVTTGEWVFREVPIPGAVLTRVASSHIRVGTFQFFAARGDIEGVRTLADHVIARHYPEAAAAGNPYLALLDAVVAQQATLIARWLLVGFIHGVMNTDNMSIAGETIDFGPCAFMDDYDPGKVYSSIDQMGRYAYGNQPRIAQWNLTRLAETLLPLLADDQEAGIAHAQASIDAFAAQFETAYAAGLRAKIGLQSVRDGDFALAQDLLDRMAANRADFTLTFRRLADAALDPASDTDVRALFADPSSFDTWAVKWRQRLIDDGGDSTQRAVAMKQVNPLYIPRNHLIEEAIVAAVTDRDFSFFEQLTTLFEHPFDEQPGRERYTLPPEPAQVVHQTFCGT